MSARDELVELLQDNITDSLPVEPSRGEMRQQVEIAIDLLIAAGYRKPRTITTLGNLFGVAAETVILTAHERIFEYDGTSWHSPGFQVDYQPIHAWIPATVLWEAS